MDKIINWIDYDCKLIEPIISEEELVRKIEYAYRVCYNTTYKMDIESIEDSIKFIQDKMKLGHGSPLEHVSISFELVTSRSIANEIVRHRIAAYSQASLRYIKKDKGLDCILPSIFNNHDNDEYKEVFVKSVEDSYSNYLKLLNSNIKAQFARDLLPLCTATTLICTWNIREILHILDLRYFSSAAHPDLRLLMNKVYIRLKEHYPHIFINSPISID